MRRVHAFPAQHPEGAFAGVARDVGSLGVDAAAAFSGALVEGGRVAHQKLGMRNIPEVVIDCSDAVFAAGDAATGTRFALGGPSDDREFPLQTLFTLAGPSRVRRLARRAR